jgi:hypothetical protein
MLPRAAGSSAPQSAKVGVPSDKTPPSVDAAAKLPKVDPSTLMNVVVFSQEDIELFNGNLPKLGTVGDLKGKLHFDPHGVDLFFKHRETKEWTRLLSSEDCELLYLRTNMAHPRKDSALHVRAQIREVWRTQAFIGLFADPFVVRVFAQFHSFHLRACVHMNLYPCLCLPKTTHSKTPQSKLDLEGGYLIHTIRETRVMLNSFLDIPPPKKSIPAIPSFSQSDRDRFTRCKEALLTAVAHLESAEKWEVLLNETHGIAQVCEFLRQFCDSVRNLQVGNVMVWGGGWSRQFNPGHAVMHVLRRDQEDSFTLTTCNTGEGLHYHNASARSFPKDIRNHFLAVRGISRARLVDDFSWAHILWGLRFEPLQSNCPEVRFFNEQLHA